MKKLIFISAVSLIIITCVVLIFNETKQNCAGCIPCEYKQFEKRVVVISIDRNLQDSTIRSVRLGESLDISNEYIQLNSQEILDLKITDVIEKANGNPNIWFTITGEAITAGSCKPYLIDSLFVNE